MGGARKGAVARVGASAHVLRARGSPMPPAMPLRAAAPASVSKLPHFSPDSLPRVSFSGRRHRSQVPQVPPNPHRLCGHFVGTGGCKGRLFWGCATSGQLSPCHSEERENGTTELPLPGSRRPSLLFMRGIRNLRTSHRSHTSQPLFRLEQRLHRWRCSKPLCFQNRSPPLTPFGPAQRPAVIHQTTKPPITLTARPRSRPHSPSSHPQT